MTYLAGAATTLFSYWLIGLLTFSLFGIPVVADFYLTYWFIAAALTVLGGLAILSAFFRKPICKWPYFPIATGIVGFLFALLELYFISFDARIVNPILLISYMTVLSILSGALGSWVAKLAKEENNNG